MTNLPDSLLTLATIAFIVLASIGLFFLIVTRISLIIQEHSARSDPDTAHIYWIYKYPFFIKLTDHMFVVSCILLFQYRNLVAKVVERLNPSMKGKRVLQLSCAFGNVSEKIAESCARQNAAEFVLTDIMQSEVDNARRKLARFGDLCTYKRMDATDLEFEDQSFDYVVCFFLPHEVPFDKKVRLVREANRVLKPGGKLVFGEFHKPRLKLLEWAGRAYFKIFEPYAAEMWDGFDFDKVLVEQCGKNFETERDTFLFDNFQVFTAKRLA
ncbi:MAG: methyltransferase domain-containing protein [Lysobacterales bacterium]